MDVCLFTGLMCRHYSLSQRLHATTVGFSFRSSLHHRHALSVSFDGIPQHHRSQAGVAGLTLSSLYSDVGYFHHFVYYALVQALCGPR